MFSIAIVARPRVETAVVACLRRCPMCRRHVTGHKCPICAVSTVERSR